MKLFSNSEQAKGYDLAQAEINTAHALAAARSFQAACAANRMTARNQALTSDIRGLRAALTVEMKRADFFQKSADELCGMLLGLIEDHDRLAAENQALKAELAQARQDISALALQIPSPPDEYKF